MHLLRSYIETIERLLSEGTPASLTHAALECRLAIEMICHERLRNVHDYLSHDDIRTWRPRDVVMQLISEVDDKTAETLTISVCREAPESYDATGYGKLPWTPLGSQIGFEPKRLGELWNALSNVALHTKLPRAKSDQVARYGDSAKIKEKVTEALAEFTRIAQGDLIWSGLGTVVSFTCRCGTRNTRRAGLLTDGQVVSCINPACDESYGCELQGDGIAFGRRTLTLPCACESGIEIPRRSAEKLKTTEHMQASCGTCGTRVLVQWRLMQAKVSDEAEAAE